MRKNRLVDLKQLQFQVKDAMRYDDVGDYYGNIIVTYDMKDDVVNNAILIHEFVEYMLIRSAGLSSEMIDQFDNDEHSREAHPKEYKLYEKFHNLANKVERQFIENLGLSWEEHDKIIYSTPIKIESAIQTITNELHKRTKNRSEEKLKKLQTEVENQTNKEQVS